MDEFMSLLQAAIKYRYDLFLPSSDFKWFTMKLEWNITIQANLLIQKKKKKNKKKKKKITKKNLLVKLDFSI